MLAMKEGWIDRNPVSGVKFFPEANRTRFLNEDELTRLRNVMQPEDWNLIAFAIETGCGRPNSLGFDGTKSISKTAS